MGVGSSHFHHVVGETQCIGDNLAEDRLRALTDFGTGGQNEPCPRPCLQFPRWRPSFLAPAGESRAVEEGREANASLDGTGFILFLEPLLFGMVIGRGERSSHEGVHVHAVGHDLAGGGQVTVFEIVPSAKLLTRESHSLGHFFHVSLKSEEVRGFPNPR